MLRHVSRHGSTALFLKVPAGVRTVRFERPVPGSSGFRLSAHCAASRGRVRPVRRVRRVVSYRASISIKNTSFFSPAKANLMVSWRLVEIKWKRWLSQLSHLSHGQFWQCHEMSWSHKAFFVFSIPPLALHIIRMGLPPKRVLGAALTATKFAPSIDRKNSKRMLHNMVNACKYIKIYIYISKYM